MTRACADPPHSTLLAHIDTVEEVLQAHVAELGKDFTAYKNHTYRVVNFCVAMSSRERESVEKTAVAAVFHDLGIWTHGTFDYLQPSVELASAFLQRSGHVVWTPEVTAMIREHHKITPYRGDRRWLVEPFRRADWIDVTRGLRAFGLSRTILGAILTNWPSAGFHRRLVELSLKRLRTHPLAPLPMLRL